MLVGPSESGKRTLLRRLASPIRSESLMPLTENFGEFRTEVSAASPTEKCYTIVNLSGLAFYQNFIFVLNHKQLVRSIHGV